MANFLFVLSHDDNEAATRCFQLAQIAHSKGHKTDLFFINNIIIINKAIAVLIINFIINFNVPVLLAHELIFQLKLISNCSRLAIRFSSK